MTPQDDFTLIWRPIDVNAVTLIHGVLSDTGIRYFITNENAAQWEGALGVGAASMELRVEKDRAAEAFALVKGILEPEAAPSDKKSP